jgi:hypothetical protein
LRLQGFVAPNPYHFDCFPLRFKRSMTGVRFRYAFAALRLLNHRNAFRTFAAGNRSWL